MRKLVGTLGVLLFVAVGVVGGMRVWNLAGSTFDRLTSPAHIAAGVTPHLNVADAQRITLAYLDAQRGLLLVPTVHVRPAFSSMWALTADAAAGLDGCIPAGKGPGVVWVVKGRGDYFNPVGHPWSAGAPSTGTPAQAPCAAAAQAGTIVIDDVTGEILGVYPDQGAAAPHPSPAVAQPGG